MASTLFFPELRHCILFFFLGRFISAGSHEVESGNAQTLQTVSKAVTFHFNDHKRCTEPHETVNTHTSICLHSLLLNFLRDFVRFSLVLRDLSLLSPASTQLLLQSAAPTASLLPLSHRTPLLRPCTTLLSFLTKLLLLPKILPGFEIQTLPPGSFVLDPP